MDRYVEIIYYLESTSPFASSNSTDVLAYVQVYDVQRHAELIQQKSARGDCIFIEVKDIRSLLARFQCSGGSGTRQQTRMWFIDRNRLYRVISSISGYQQRDSGELADDGDSDGDFGDGLDDESDDEGELFYIPGEE